LRQVERNVLLQVWIQECHDVDGMWEVFAGSVGMW